MKNINVLLSGSIDEIENTIFVKKTYIQAVKKAGATPYLYSNGNQKKAASLFDCLILCGGVDISPKYFGEQILNQSVKICKERDKNEFKLIEHFVNKKKPILGICRGIQVLNVYFGGSLWQDLPLQQGFFHQGVLHKVNLTNESFLSFIYKSQQITVNSYHHQAIKALAKGFNTCAVSDDGVIEAIEHDSLPIVAVQWHPEKIEDNIDINMQKLFKFFIDYTKEEKINAKKNIRNEHRLVVN